MKTLISCFLASILAFATCQGQEVGNWTVGDCLHARFALSLSLDLTNRTDLNETMHVMLPVSRAKVDGDQSNCGKTQQFLSLTWSDTSANNTQLSRNITFQFEKVNDTDTQSLRYGVQRVYGYLELAKFETKVKNVTMNITSFVDIDTGDRSKVMYRVPVNYSYVCRNAGELLLGTRLHYNFPNAPDAGTDLKNATSLTLTNVTFAAFWPKGASMLENPIDCDAMPNDIVPIIVGVSLALLVVLVLVAYMVGRRKRRQNGYTSV